MRKRLSVFLCLLLGLSLTSGLLSGCGSAHTGAACLDIVKGCASVAEAGSFDTWASYGEALYDDSFSTMYGVQYDMLDDGAILYTGEGGLADEISVMHLKESGDVSIAKSKLEDRIIQRRKTFVGYKPEEVSKLDNAYVMVQGNYVALLISDDNTRFETEIRRIISEGNA